jgi:hypothetical protein
MGKSVDPVELIVAVVRAEELLLVAVVVVVRLDPFSLEGLLRALFGRG